MFLLSLFILISSVSSAFQAHYCGGEFKSIELQVAEQGNCCGEENSTPIDGLNFSKVKCCENITLQSVDLDYLSDFESLRPSVPAFELELPVRTLSESLVLDNQKFISKLINDPPFLSGKVPVFKKVQVYLI